MKKDKEWLKEKIKDEEHDLKYVYDNYVPYEKVLIADDVHDLIDQLDEPETLSLEWIEENKVARINDVRKMTTSVVLPVEKLKNLLVPKQDKPEVEENFYTFDNAKKWLQDNGFVVFEKDKLDEEVQRMIDETYKAMSEKPVIPQFIADWYEENLSGGYTNNRNKFSGNDVFRVIQDVLNIREGLNTWEDYNLDEKIVAWVEGNEEDFIHLIVNCSYKDGYEVEKEKRYHVVNKENYFLLRKYDGLVDILHTLTAMSRDKYGKDTRFMLTEQEIKDYDERFLVFAEEVTE